MRLKNALRRGAAAAVIAGHRQAETAIRPVNPAALGAGTRDAETDLHTITKNHR